VPATSQTFCFRAESFTPDWEQPLTVWLRFPAGWAVTNVTVQGTPVCDQGGGWGPFSWAFETYPNEIRINHKRLMKKIDHCVATYCVDVVSGTGAPDAKESWYWYCEPWGDPPNYPCSSDGYTPAGQEACDEAVKPPASVPACNAEPGLYLDPGSAIVEGCNGAAQTARFGLTNFTGAAGTFAMAYSVTSGNGVLTGPPSLTIGSGERVLFNVALTPELCGVPGDVVNGLIQASGNGYADQATVDETVWQGAWKIRRATPTAAYDWVVVSATDPNDGLDYLYVFGSRYGLQTYRYDPRSDTWATLASLPDKLWDAGDGVAYNGHIYARTDGQATTTNKLFDYSIASNTWTATDVPAPIADRSLYEAVKLGGWIYFIGGAQMPDSVTTGEVDRYNPGTGAWETVAPLLHKRDSAAAWAYKGKIYVAGGSVDGADLKSTEVYDPATNSWTDNPSLFAALPERWAGAADATLHGDQLWLSGGLYAAGYTTRTAYWTEAGNTWHEGPRLAQAVGWTEADALLGQMYMVGGYFSGPHNYNQLLVECPGRLTWATKVNGQPWQSGVPVTVQTADTLTVNETVTGTDFALDELWESDKLQLTGYEASDGAVVVQAGSLEWQVAQGQVVPHTLTLWFRVLPCTWTDTTLAGTLSPACGQAEGKPVLVHKLPPVLWIDATYLRNVLPGQPAAFTLSYGNTGGYENDAMLRAEFPDEARFQQSVPAPSRVDPAGLWAEWDVGDLAQGAQASIGVTALIAPDVPPLTTLLVTGDLYDHVDVVRDSATVEWTVGQVYSYRFLPVVGKNH
jgi:hypothetical protein